MDQASQQLGRVIEVRKHSYIIESQGREIAAKLRGGFLEGRQDGLPVVGDYVLFTPNPAGESVIQSVRERKSFLCRPKGGAMQCMAANVDFCFIVTSLNGDYSPRRIARYASLALQGGAIPVAVLTKADVCGETERCRREVESVSGDLRVHAVSALTGTGMDELGRYFVPGKTICLLGSSGAGKSTLVNALAGAEVMKTGAIRQSDSRGRHTTTHRQLITLENGVSVIDMPGMREVGMAGTEEGIERTFSDIAALERKCRFRDCRHGGEPGCAVRAAILSGELSRERFALYMSLGTESAGSRARMKEISKWQKAYKKQKGRTE